MVSVEKGLANASPFCTWEKGGFERKIKCCQDYMDFS